MWKPFRKQLIASHQFYFDQAGTRLLSQFHNLEKDADIYADEWLEKAGQHFDPERHDPSDLYEQANDESIQFYQMLDDMRNRTRLSVAAGMFHEWDKQLRTWISEEINHWHCGDEARKAIWKASFGEIIDLFESLGWRIRANSYYDSLDRCRLVVNVYKHGNGVALTNIKSDHPEFVSHSDPQFIEYTDHTHLKVEDAHLNEFSEAIINFWKDVPEYIWEKETLTLPDWFGKAYNKDHEK